MALRDDHIEALKAMRSVFEGIPAPCSERDALDVAIALLAEPDDDGLRIPEGWALVPKQMVLGPQDVAAIAFHCGTGDEDVEEWTDGLLWVGETIGDDGAQSWGLNIATAEYPEEGSTPVVTFDRPAAMSQTTQQEGRGCER